MAVAHDAATESHTVTTPSLNEASFNFSHNPVGVPRGVLIYTISYHLTTPTDVVTAVTYDGVNVPVVVGGMTVDTADEPGRVKTWFLGSSVPTTDPATVVVTRTNNNVSVYAICITVTAAGDTAVTGILLEQDDQALTEENIDDGSPGSDSVRYVGLFSGHSAIASIPPGANSTALASIDIGAQMLAAVRETTAGQGARPVGFVATSEDVAAVYLAIKEAGPAAQPLVGVLFTKAPTFPQGAITTGPVTVTGTLFTKAPTFPTGTVTATYSLTGVLFSKAPTFPQGAVTSGGVTLTGTLFVKAPTFPQGAVTTGGVTVTGVLFTKAPTFPTGVVTAGAAALTGILFQKAPTFPTGTIGQAGTLFGTLFVKAPTFFTGSFVQGGPSFWTPNPAAYVGVTRYGPSPWGAELSGQRFEKAPTFPVGAVS